jgi:glycosyltransferase involved in cell wall biosynthesis
LCYLYSVAFLKAKGYNFDLVKKTKALSIALVSSYPFTDEPGGVKDFILGLKEALIKRECKVSVVAPGSRGSRKKGLVDFVLGTGFRVATDQTEFRASLSRKKTARKILEAVKPDIIVINEPFVPSIGHTLISAVIAAKGKIKRPVFVGQFHASRENFNWRLKLVEFVARHLIRRPKLSRKTILGLSAGYVNTINNNLNGRIAISKSTKRFWQSKLPENYKVIYNGIDTDKLTIEGPRIDEWMKDGKKIILFAGRHDHRKGIDDLINAFNILVQNGQDNIKLLITGRGEMTEKLQKMVSEMVLTNFVQFVGILPRTELIKAYRTADLLVAPSTGGEGFNRTIAEARSCGTLVVCTNIDGHREAIGKDLSPFMAQPKNPHNLARQIIKVLNLSKAEKQKIIKQSKEDTVANFSWNKIAKDHLEYYRSLVFN